MQFNLIQEGCVLILRWQEFPICPLEQWRQMLKISPSAICISLPEYNQILFDASLHFMVCLLEASYYTQQIICYTSIFFLASYSLHTETGETIVPLPTGIRGMKRSLYVTKLTTNLSAINWTQIGMLVDSYSKPLPFLNCLHTLQNPLDFRTVFKSQEIGRDR